MPPHYLAEERAIEDLLDAIAAAEKSAGMTPQEISDAMAQMEQDIAKLLPPKAHSANVATYLTIKIGALKRRLRATEKRVQPKIQPKNF